VAEFSFETDPDHYVHWRFRIDGARARLTLAVQADRPLLAGYQLKLNSYDLGVDLELADAVQRLRFEHPEVRTVVITSELERVFCAGANIFMLGSSPHGFKVNFCKFTNETRLAIEEASARSGQKYLAACNGVTAGGGYELALACDRILLLDDGNSAVSLPEVPLLGVLPGTGGLTRLVDKRKVRRDRADLFCTLAEGVKGKRALEWGLVDGLAPRSQFEAAIDQQCQLLAPPPPRPGRGVRLERLEPVVRAERIGYRHVELLLRPQQRVAELVLSLPAQPPPDRWPEIEGAGSAWWPLRAFRELDDAILRLRFHQPEIGLVMLRTRGRLEDALALDHALLAHADHHLAHEVRLLIGRTLRRLELTAKSLFAVIDEGSCFGGSLLELALLADRAYMLDQDQPPVQIALSPMNGGALPMSHGLSRLQVRCLADPGRAERLLAEREPLDAEAAERAGLITARADQLDFEDELRLAAEERSSLSPDALTGMEASLRFAGPESLETKIFGRLSAWQNWIFQRPNAVGDHGALTRYGQPEQPRFDWRRT
jgi:benzoyl-CoA-dihydrodiol lyase